MLPGLLRISLKVKGDGGRVRELVIEQREFRRCIVSDATYSDLSRAMDTVHILEVHQTIV